MHMLFYFLLYFILVGKKNKTTTKRHIHRVQLQLQVSSLKISAKQYKCKMQGQYLHMNSLLLFSIQSEVREEEYIGCSTVYQHNLIQPYIITTAIITMAFTTSSLSSSPFLENSRRNLIMSSVIVLQKFNNQNVELTTAVFDSCICSML